MSIFTVLGLGVLLLVTIRSIVRVERRLNMFKKVGLDPFKTDAQLDSEARKQAQVNKGFR